MKYDIVTRDPNNIYLVKRDNSDKPWEWVCAVDGMGLSEAMRMRDALNKDLTVQERHPEVPWVSHDDDYATLDDLSTKE